MHTYASPSRNEKVISGAFAFGMHLLFLALLIFGVTWQKQADPQANIVDLWATLPQQAKPKAELPPPPPKPEVKPQEKPIPPPPVKAAPKPEIAKPDIAMKAKAAKEKAAKEKAAKEKAEKEKAEKQKTEKEKAEKQKAEKDKQIAAKKLEEAKAAEKKQQEKEAEAQQLAKEKADEQRRVAAARLSNEYIERIRARIKRFVVMPPNIQGNPKAEFDVVLLPGGEVLSVKLKRASGNAAYDSAVERAILKAQPLPLPPDPAMFKDFRELNLEFRPQE